MGARATYIAFTHDSRTKNLYDLKKPQYGWFVVYWGRPGESGDDVDQIARQVIMDGDPDWHHDPQKLRRLRNLVTLALSYAERKWGVRKAVLDSKRLLEERSTINATLPLAQRDSSGWSPPFIAGQIITHGDPRWYHTPEIYQRLRNLIVLGLADASHRPGLRNSVLEGKLLLERRK